MLQLSDYKLHPKNPRIVGDAKYKRLVKSIKKNPKFLLFRPLVYNEKNELIAGNMRYKALLELGYTEIPDEWAKSAADLTDEEKKEFMLTDNIIAGDWDISILANEWEADLVALTGMVIEAGDFSKEYMKYDDSNAEYPLMAMYDEKYDAVIIIAETKTEMARLKTYLGIGGKKQSYKSTYIGETNCHYFKDLKLKE